MLTFHWKNTKYRKRNMFCLFVRNHVRLKNFKRRIEELAKGQLFRQRNNNSSSSQTWQVMKIEIFSRIEDTVQGKNFKR